MNLKLCTRCGVREHSLEDFPVVLKKLLNKNNINLVSGVPKNDMIKNKNLQIVTR